MSFFAGTLPHLAAFYCPLGVNFFRTFHSTAAAADGALTYKFSHFAASSRRVKVCRTRLGQLARRGPKFIFAARVADGLP